MLTEEEIYIKMKKHLKNLGWTLLGGEPPGGTDFELRVIEMKGSDTGSSLGSKKIDLIGFKDNFFLLLELKKVYAESDIDKLNEICDSEIWRREFLHALEQKHRLPPNLQTENYTVNDDLLIKALGFNDTRKTGPEDFITFLVSDNDIQAHFGADIPQTIRDLF